MTASYVNNGDGTITVKYEYTAILETVQNTIDDAAHYLHDREAWAQMYDQNGVIIPWSDLTNSQKLNIMNRAIVRYHLSLASSFYVEDAVGETRVIAGDEAKERYLSEE